MHVIRLFAKDSFKCIRIVQKKVHFIDLSINWDEKEVYSSFYWIDSSILMHYNVYTLSKEDKMKPIMIANESLGVIERICLFSLAVLVSVLTIV